MAELSKTQPLPPASLERFVEVEDRELGLGASDISDEAKKRHYGRYARIANMIAPFVGKRDMVADIGCGSGYGTRMLRQRFYRVVGVEPNDLARKYAAKHHPTLLFANDYEGADVCVFVESIEHMTDPEFVGYIGKAHTVAITTPLVEHPYNDYHESPFKTAEEVHERLFKHGFKPADTFIQQGITFTTGEVGSQFVAVYRRAV